MKTEDDTMPPCSEEIGHLWEEIFSIRLAYCEDRVNVTYMKREVLS